MSQILLGYIHAKEDIQKGDLCAVLQDEETKKYVVENCDDRLFKSAPSMPDPREATQPSRVDLRNEIKKGRRNFWEELFCFHDWEGQGIPYLMRCTKCGAERSAYI